MVSIESEGDKVRGYVLQKLSNLNDAQGYKDVEWTFRRGIINGLAAKGFLTLEKLIFELDPVIAKIATFEPLESSSQSLKVGDSACGILHWGSTVDDILQLTRDRIRTAYIDDQEHLVGILEIYFDDTPPKLTWEKRKGIPPDVQSLFVAQKPPY